MKITRKKIQAASDYRTFDGLSVDELEESESELYYDYFFDIRKDIREAFISKNRDCKYVGVEDQEGKYYIYDAEGSEGPGWYEVTFDQLFEYLQ